jgi:trimeric autotransporter adhesin
MKTFITAVIVNLSLIAMPTAFAGEVVGLNSFTAGTPARAANVNDNFTAVKTAVDDNHARIALLETANTALAAANAALQTDNTTLNARLAALEAKLASVSLQTVNGQPTVRFEGVNVQIVNGLTATDSVNGTGNLLVGYDEMRTTGAGVCSLGTNASSVPITDATACATAGGIFALNHKSGSHNLVVGSQHNYSRTAGAVFGFNNTVNGRFASVSGGSYNTASGLQASVSGGFNNNASGSQASVSGGQNNTASGISASVSGGASNTANGLAASVSGGGGNFASGSAASVSGGFNNNASGSQASVSGGSSRSAPNTNDWSAGALFQDF